MVTFLTGQGSSYVARCICAQLKRVGKKVEVMHQGGTAREIVSATTRNDEVIVCSLREPDVSVTYIIDMYIKVEDWRFKECQVNKSYPGQTTMEPNHV